MSQVPVSHGDRLVFGQSYFVLVFPSKGQAKQLLEAGALSFEVAKKELAEKQGRGGGELSFKNVLSRWKYRWLTQLTRQTISPTSWRKNREEMEGGLFLQKWLVCLGRYLGRSTHLFKNVRSTHFPVSRLSRWLSGLTRQITPPILNCHTPPQTCYCLKLPYSHKATLRNIL
jgi:hypothetical protein